LETTSSSRPLCSLWLRGECNGGRAAVCRARHFYLDSDSDSHDRSRTRTRAGPALQRFSSPYRTRIVTEQVQVQREAVNLESGQSQTWLELQEREVVDLTGRSGDIINLSSVTESVKEHDNKILESSITSKFEIMNDEIPLDKNVDGIYDSEVCDASIQNSEGDELQSEKRKFGENMKTVKQLKKLQDELKVLKLKLKSEESNRALKRIKSKRRKARKVKAVMKSNVRELRQGSEKFEIIKVSKEIPERIKSKKRKAGKVKNVKSREIKGKFEELKANSVKVEVPKFKMESQN